MDLFSEKKQCFVAFVSDIFSVNQFVFELCVFKNMEKSFEPKKKKSAFVPRGGIEKCSFLRGASDIGQNSPAKKNQDFFNEKIVWKN